MVLAHHVIFSAYGFWLPNDPRGSWSDFVRRWELVRLGGRATKVSTRRSLARDEHDVAARIRGKRGLKYPPVVFTGRQAQVIGAAFADAAAEGRYVVHACSILPEHVHVVVGRHARSAERIVGHLKARATQALLAAELHPLAAHRRASGPAPTPWGRKGWYVYLDTPAAVRRAIRYVEENPVREGECRQRWTFVTGYEGA